LEGNNEINCMVGPNRPLLRKVNKMVRINSAETWDTRHIPDLGI